MVSPVIMYGCESWTVKKAECQRIDAFELWCWRRLQGDPTSPFWRRSALGVHCKDWCWCWNSNTLATSCEELTHWKRLWCWEGLGAGGEGEDRGWDGWMASLTRWTWMWVNSRSWWWTGRPGVLRFMGSQRVRHDWATELNWYLNCFSPKLVFCSLITSLLFFLSMKGFAYWDSLFLNFQTQRINWLNLQCAHGWGII